MPENTHERPTQSPILFELYEADVRDRHKDCAPWTRTGHSGCDVPDLLNELERTTGGRFEAPEKRRTAMASECPGIETEPESWEPCDRVTCPEMHQVAAIVEHCPCCHPEAHATLEAVRQLRASLEKMAGHSVQAMLTPLWVIEQIDAALAASPRGDVLTEEEREWVETTRALIARITAPSHTMHAAYLAQMVRILDRLAPAPTR